MDSCGFGERDFGMCRAFGGLLFIYLLHAEKLQFPRKPSYS